MPARNVNNVNGLAEVVRSCLSHIQVVDLGEDRTKVRLGREGDGGYVLLHQLCLEAECLFSFGIGGDVSFELDVVSRYKGVKQAYLFDPFLVGPPEDRDVFRFYPWPFDGRVFPPQGRSILKVDVEWAEWDGFFRMDSELLQSFDQIVVEFHFIHVKSLPPGVDHSPYFYGFYCDVYDKINKNLFEKYNRVLRKIGQYFHIFHIHANNSLPPVTVGGVTFPPLLEVSYVRKDLVSEFRPTVWKFPNPSVDFPNKSDRPDIEDYYPLGAVHVER